MIGKINALDFTGQDFFISIDTHLRKWVVTIQNQNIQLRRFSMNPSPHELYTYMNKHYPSDTFHCVYEAGFSGFWQHRELEQLESEITAHIQYFYNMMQR